MIVPRPNQYLPMLIAAAILMLTAIATAETESAASSGARPRIGLVLGGGGARGAAHVGVLRELERMRIPIDAIAGTSMGAIIGGLYASGMSAAELEELVVSLDWATVLSDAPRRRDLSFRRKQDDEQFPIDLEFGIKDGDLLLPKGVVQGQKLDLILRELTIDVSHISNFDDLPIPFRAIASDIALGEMYVMGQGDLARSIRASMSVPGLIAPVRLGGRLLVDGGLVGNLPIDVMRTMDVDIIIAVNVEFPLYAPHDLESAVAITEQMLTVLIRMETLRQIEQLKSDDVLISPELGNFAVTNFGEIAEAIGPGANATIAAGDKLRKLGVDAEAYAEYVARREVRKIYDQRLAFVRIVHDGRVSTELLESRLGIESGDAINTKWLAAGADRLHGLDLYERVSYRLVDEGGTTGVEYEAISKSWGPDLLKFGLSVEDDFAGSTAFNVSARLTRTGINQKGAEWRTDIRLGTDPLLFSEFYQPFGSNSRLFIAPRLEMRQSNLNAFVAEDAVARLRITEAETGIDLGAEIGSFGELRLGAYRGIGEARVKVGDPSLPNVDFDTGGFIASLRIDTLDSAYFPQHGVRADLRWNLSRPALGADDNFDTFESNFTAVWSRGKSSLQFGLGYATTMDSYDAVQDYFPLGGFLQLSGLQRGEISGPHTALTRLVYYRRVSSSSGGLFDIPVYIGASVEAGNAWQSHSDIRIDSLLFNGSVFVGFDTYFGPVYVAAGFGENGRTNYYLFIGSPN